jgi:hypothetical protein
MNITYTFDQALDHGQGFLGHATGSITGWISTDGTIGPITAVNIVGFDVTATVGQTSFEFIRGINAGAIWSYPTSGLSATPTELLFNYSPPYSFGFSHGAGTGYIIDWQSGDGGLVVAEPASLPSTCDQARGLR